MNFENEIMNLNEVGGVKYLTFKALCEERFNFVRYAFSTRIGGISRNEFDSMNLSFSTGDSPQNVLKNFEIFCKNAGFDQKMLVIPEQTHSNNVKIVTDADSVSDDLVSKRIENTDGLITNRRGLVLTSFHADCNSLFFVDVQTKVIGLAHAGWRGTVKKIAQNMVDLIMKNFDSSTKNLFCFMGPAIQKCCFEVKEDILGDFIDMKIRNIWDFIKKNSDSDTYNIDLIGVNRQILLNSGLPAENIFFTNLCTKCNPNLFYSHRKCGPKRGSMAAFASLI